MARRSAEARKLLADMDAELAAAAARRGQPLEWTAQDRAVLALIAATIDRKTQLHRAYDRADTVALQVKLSAELRLLESQQARLIKQVTPDVPAAPASAASRKASKAAHARWDRAANA